MMTYMLIYAFMNMGAFAVVIMLDKGEEIKDYEGLAKSRPIVAALMLVFMFSLTGIPPTAGFIGKFFVFGAALRQNFVFLAAIGVVNSVISVFYYFNVVRASFFLEAKDASRIATPRLAALALAVCGVIVLVFSIVPQPFINFAQLTTAMLGLK